MSNDGAGRSDVHIDTSLIPPQNRDNLARCTLALLHNILATPGGREALERQKVVSRAACQAAGR